MAKSQWIAIDNTVVQGVYEFKEEKTENDIQLFFPDMVVMDVTNMIPQPGPKWTYDGVDFFPPLSPPGSTFNPISIAHDLIATIDFKKLNSDEGKALTVILYLLGALDEEVVM